MSENKSKYKLIIAGSRKVTDMKILEKALAYADIKPEDVSEVVCGMAAGVDTLGMYWGQKHGIAIAEYPAQWKDLKSEPVYIKNGAYGPYNCLAGFARNRKMAKRGDRLLAIWSDSSPGTENMIEEMKSLNKPVVVYEI